MTRPDGKTISEVKVVANLKLKLTASRLNRENALCLCENQDFCVFQSTQYTSEHQD